MFYTDIKLKFKKYSPYLFLLFIAVILVLVYRSRNGVPSPPNVNKPFPPFSDDPTPQEITSFTISIVNTFYHDSSHFTQGFEIVDGFLYEGTGMNGESVLTKKNLQTGSTLKSVSLDSQYFGEGITVFKDKIYQITWKSRIGFIYDKESFALLGNWTYNYDGWGLTHDDKYLIISDGTPTVRYLDPDTLEGAKNVKSVKEIRVRRSNNHTQNQINELEYIDGKIWANVWMTNDIIIINPSNGLIVAKIELRKLKSEISSGDVLNGIAYDHDTDRLYVTGKYWDKMFEINVIPVKSRQKSG